LGKLYNFHFPLLLDSRSTS